MTDLEIAKAYVNKARNAESRDIEFTLPFSEYKKLVTKKKCYYTGMSITKGLENSAHELTIDRIDSTKGYVTGNCVACSHYFNKLKSVFENGKECEIWKSSYYLQIIDTSKGVIRLQVKKGLEIAVIYATYGTMEQSHFQKML
jgi:hypothetical protein